ncbi:MAG: hypothetical protein JWR80_8095 [Bradyrhizobium sp.]|nr:hypothetical protein [Bradyrhizobium sp.]
MDVVTRRSLVGAIALAAPFAIASTANATGLAPTQTPRAIERGAWDASVARYRAALALWDAIGADSTDGQWDAVSKIYNPAFETLIDTPAPDIAALALKIEIATLDQRTPGIAETQAILADARRLAIDRHR